MQYQFKKPTGKNNQTSLQSSNLLIITDITDKMVVLKNKITRIITFLRPMHLHNQTSTMINYQLVFII